MLLKIRTLIGKFSRENDGATGIEYGLICALVFLAIVVSVQGMAGHVVTTYENVGKAVAKATTP